MADDFYSHDPFDEDEPKARQKARLLRDVLRKTVSQGVEARQATEDTLRHIVGELKLPREIGNVVLQQADQIKTEVVRVVAGEVRNFLGEANLGEEIAKILTSLSFEIRTEIRFIPNDEALKPNVRSRVGIKSKRDSATSEEEGDDDEGLTETPDTRVLDNAIRKGVTNLASRFMQRIVAFDDDPLADTTDDDGENPAPRNTPKVVPSSGRAASVKPKTVASPGAGKPKAAATVRRKPAATPEPSRGTTPARKPDTGTKK